MLKMTSVAGNAFCGNASGLPEGRRCGRLRLPRTDLERNRMRRRTDAGHDVAVMLEPGTVLHDGDILTDGTNTVTVEQLPETVIAARPLDGAATPADLLVMIGHTIGNMHRPVSVEDGTIYFPIQAESEIGVFQGLFAGAAGRIRLSVEERVFRPRPGADVRGHD